LCILFPVAKAADASRVPPRTPFDSSFPAGFEDSDFTDFVAPVFRTFFFEPNEDASIEGSDPKS
jgi:hypothetical protein